MNSCAFRRTGVFCSRCGQEIMETTVSGGALSLVRCGCSGKDRFRDEEIIPECPINPMIYRNKPFLISSRILNWTGYCCQKCGKRIYFVVDIYSDGTIMSEKRCHGCKDHDCVHCDC